MNIYALQTAREGSKSVPSKNLLKIDGKPLYKWNYEEAKKCPLIKRTFISTDIPEILISNHKDAIQRPEHLCTDTASHHETIIHGLYNIETIVQERVDILVILLGNNKGATSGDLVRGINKVKNFPGYDGAMSVGEYNMFNPYRAYKMNPNQGLDTYIDQEQYPDINNLNNKDAYGSVYFFNGSFWVCKRENIIKNNGLQPFPWVGTNIAPIVQDSKIMELDASWQIPLI